MTFFLSKPASQGAVAPDMTPHSAQPVPTPSPKPSQRPILDVKGVLVSPQPANTIGQCHDSMLKCQKFDASLLKDSAWKTLPLPELLGLPLQFVKWPSPKGGVNYNHLIQVLSIDADCSHPAEKLEESGFGQTAYLPICGGIMIVREDANALSEKHVEALAVYVDTYLEELFRFGGGRWKHKTLSEVRELQGKIAANVRPEGFAAFWKHHQTMKIKAGIKDWESVECPVEHESDATSPKPGDHNSA